VNLGIQNNSKKTSPAIWVIIKKELENLINFIGQNTELTDSESFVIKIKVLEESKRKVEEKLTSINRDIERMEKQRINETELRKVFREFNQIYQTLPFERKRRLNHLFFVEIISHMKRKEDNGLLEFHIRGDGTLTTAWNDLVNQINSGSSFRGSWLHRQDSNLRPSG
jgi:hypothetical protein